MRKILVYFFLFCLLIFAQENLLKNGSFEKGHILPDGWKCSTWQPSGDIGKSMVLTDEKAIDGKKSVKIDTSLTEANYLELKQALSTELKGKKIILKGKLYIEKIEGEDGIAEIYFRIRQWEDKEYKKLGSDALRTWIVIKKDEMRIAETKLTENKPVLLPERIIKDFMNKWVDFYCSGIVADNDYPKEFFISLPTFKGIKGIFYLDDLTLKIVENNEGEAFKIKIDKINNLLKGTLEIMDDFNDLSGFFYVEKIEDGHLIIREEKEIPNLLKGINKFELSMDKFPPDKYISIFHVKLSGRTIKVFKLIGE